MASNILITGALGFLGNFFVKELLRREPEAQLYLLVRDKGLDTAEGRVHAAGFMTPNVTVIPGDVTDPDLVEKCCGAGVSPVNHRQDAHATLPPMDEIWHIAGLTTFNEKKADQLVSVNIHGTTNMILLAERLGCRKFFHISTAYVAGRCDGPVLEDELVRNPSFRNSYERTKYYGERLVRDSGLPWVIIRPSIIVGHSQTGEAESDKMVYGVVRCYHTLASWLERNVHDHNGRRPKLRYVVRADYDVAKNLICVDDCVRIMLAARERGALRRTYHACHHQTLDTGAEHQIMCRILGIDYLKIDPSHDGTTDVVQKFIDRGLRVFEPYMLHSDPIFDLSNTRALGGYELHPMDAERFTFLVKCYVENLREREDTVLQRLDAYLERSQLAAVH